MILCARCGGVLTSSFDRDRCPQCGAANPTVQSDCWSSVAQLSNLAEAGFFADWLEGEGISARVHHHDSFSALHDTWNTTYELHVPASQAQQAVALLRDILREENDDEEALPSNVTDGLRLSSFLVGSPVIWIILAGGLAYVLGRSGWAPVHREMRSGLWQVVAESPPLWSEPRDGQPRRCLRYDKTTGEIILDVDLDRDGQWDFQQRFVPVP